MYEKINNLGIYNSIESIWAAHPEGGREGDWVTVGDKVYCWDKYAETWTDEAATEPSKPITGDVPVKHEDINFLGQYDTINNLWSKYPEGGKEGDYATIGVNNDKYWWNKYNSIWDKSEYKEGEEKETGNDVKINADEINNLGIFKSLDELWGIYPEGGKEGDYATIGVNNDKYWWNKYTSKWTNTPLSTVSGPTVSVVAKGDVSYSEQDITNLGIFDNIELAWNKYPAGGRSGDYLYIGNKKYWWNPYILQWQDADSIIPAVPKQTYNLEGNVIINGDAHVYNDLRIGHDASVNNNFTVGGTLYSKHAELPEYDQKIKEIASSIPSSLPASGGSSDTTKNLSPNSSDWDRVLRKDKDDETDRDYKFNGKVSLKESIIDLVLELTKFAKGISIGEKTLLDILTSKDGNYFNDTSILSSLKAINTFLRKDQEDGTNYLLKLLGGIITNSIKSTKYVEGILGNGFAIHYDEDGKAYMQTDKLVVTMKAIFAKLEIRELSYVGGNFIFSSAGSKITKVEETDTAYRCYLHVDDGETSTMNMWKVDDQAKCETFNIKKGVYSNVANRYYWRKVVSVGDDYIDLSKTDYDISAQNDIPVTGDVIVHEGNKTDTERQNMIAIMAVGEEAPAIIQYQGINDYNLDTHRYTTISPKGNNFIANSYKIIIEGKAYDVASMADIKVLSDSITETVSSIQKDLDSKLKSKGTWVPGPHKANDLVTLNNQMFVALIDNSDCPIVPLTDENGDYLVDENNNILVPTDENGHVTYNSSWKPYTSNEGVEDNIKEFKTDTSSTFKLMSDKIDSKVASTTFDALGKTVSEQSSEISQVPDKITESISASIEKDGAIYQAVTSSLTLDGNKVKLFGKEIDITGAVVFSDLGKSIKSATDTASDAKSAAENAQKDATEALDYRDTFAKNLGYSSLSDLEASAKLGKTIIENGLIRSDLIEAKKVLTEAFAAASASTEELDAKNARIQNLNVGNGTIFNLRSPWSLLLDNNSMPESDCIVLGHDYTWTGAYSLGWDISYSGRHIYITASDLTTSQRGIAKIEAPTGKYFYQDGLAISTLTITNEVVELMGYGRYGIFCGWIVLSRAKLYQDFPVGDSIPVLARGSVQGFSDHAYVIAKMYNGGYINGTKYNITADRLSQGCYRVNIPTQWGLTSNYMVIVNGFGHALEDANPAYSPIKANIKTIADGYFDVVTSDDATANDGNFYFIVLNMGII